jgi:hypothetical protein
VRLRAAIALIALLCAAAAGAIAAPSGPGGNPPWFPSLMAFEHHDSARSHVFAGADFDGSFRGPNRVRVRTSPDDYLTPYNVIYLGPRAMFVYGGGYGDKGGVGAFVARVNPRTLRAEWVNQLINTVQTDEWDYPGVVSALGDGVLYVIYGYRLAKLDPRDGHVIQQVELPTPAQPRDTSYNGLDALPDGTLIAKTVYRQQGCDEQGFQAALKCQDPTDVPNSIIVAIDPRTLRVVDQITAPEFIGGRITSVRFRGRSYVYVAGRTQIYRYVYARRTLSLDPAWGPVTYLDPATGQTPASAVVVMNDWVVFQDNSTPAVATGSSPWLTVTAINQADASKMFVAQPFTGFRSPPGFPVSFASAAVSADPVSNRIYTLDSGPGRIGVLQLRPDGLRTVWTKRQRTTEFLALIGPPGRRVVVGTEIPPGQAPGLNTNDRVVWRAAATGRALARSRKLPAVGTGTMVQPGYAGRVYFMGQQDKIIELTATPAPRGRRPAAPGGPRA